MTVLLPNMYIKEIFPLYISRERLLLSKYIKTYNPRFDVSDYIKKKDNRTFSNDSIRSCYIQNTIIS